MFDQSKEGLERLVGLNTPSSPGFRGLTKAASHYDEVHCLFQAHDQFMRPFMRLEDIQTSANMIELWTTFAANKGNPTSPQNEVYWERLVLCTVLYQNFIVQYTIQFIFRVDPDEPKRLHIAHELTMASRTPEEEALYKYWNKLWMTEFPLVRRNLNYWDDTAQMFERNDHVYGKPTYYENKYPDARKNEL